MLLRRTAAKPLTNADLIKDLTQIQNNTPKAANLLFLCALLAARPIPKHLLHLNKEFSVSLQHLATNWLQDDPSGYFYILTEPKLILLQNYLKLIKTDELEEEEKLLMQQLTAVVIRDLNNGIACDPVEKAAIQDIYLAHVEILLAFAKKYSTDLQHDVQLEGVLRYIKQEPGLTEEDQQESQEKDAHFEKEMAGLIEKVANPGVKQDQAPEPAHTPLNPADVNREVDQLLGRRAESNSNLHQAVDELARAVEERKSSDAPQPSAEGQKVKRTRKKKERGSLSYAGTLFAVAVTGVAVVAGTVYVAKHGVPSPKSGNG